LLKWTAIWCHFITRGRENYMIWSKYGGVGENILQETFDDDVTMPNVAPDCY
jgi:hypothetical protein